MANRQIYQVDLLYVGPTGNNNATGKHFAGATYGVNPTGAGAQVGANLTAELYRVQRADYNIAKSLQDVNQFGELAAIDRISIEQPTVSLSFNYLLANLVNESLIGLTVSKPGEALVSCVSGILNATTDSKNYFIKTVSEGNDAIENADTAYNVVGLGNGFISSYTVQGAVGGFPTADVTIEGLNMEGVAFTSVITGNQIPAVNPTDGVPITGWAYRLPTGTTSYLNTNLSNSTGLSVLRPGDITLNLGLGAGDTFYTEEDLKVQSFNLSFNLSRENLSKLGSKYAFAKVITFPVTAQLQVSAIVGDSRTGNLFRMIEDNKNFDSYVTIKKPGDPNTVIANLVMKGAKLDSQDISSSIGANKTLNLTFGAQIGGPQDLTQGIFLSGITA